MAIGDVTFLSDDLVKKSPNDQRLYRYIELQNGLCAVLIHDPEICAQGPVKASENSQGTEDEDEDEDDEEEESDYEDEEDDEEGDDEGEEGDGADEDDSEGEEGNKDKKDSSHKKVIFHCSSIIHLK